ncbi:NAD-dependent protein deacetylase [Biformimicrobium ophioploci]|uniref:NAD-dependent protein deacetylase n=1 Tax=Biformimicrobium ophioploci TaxID=3036711 RepID=A0ABQ6LYR2_9GAMM|nr:NAD-dependent protein deacetylase [Microbulbifer sp. NKW57]GMG87227.1 NAD-dependent protein deacetylase [Microbulbifer sp. NKW57]
MAGIPNNPGGTNFAGTDRLPPDEAGQQLANFIGRHRRLLVLTGAGISTDSGIPAYRDERGVWKNPPPVQHQDFMGSEEARRRYWGRSLLGWPLLSTSQPSAGHHHLAEIEQRGHLELLVTQNVDRLHQRAGTRQVLDLHGRADEVVCMGCGARSERQRIHDHSAAMNPSFLQHQAGAAPDGDAQLELDFSKFLVIDCEHCGGILKPDVVFFGDNVPRDRVDVALRALQQSDALLVVGSSLMVYSGFRFCRHAHAWGKPIAALTLGRTRADDLLDLKLNASIGETLQVLLEQM